MSFFQGEGRWNRGGGGWEFVTLGFKISIFIQGIKSRRADQSGGGTSIDV